MMDKNEAVSCESLVIWECLLLKVIVKELPSGTWLISSLFALKPFHLDILPSS